MNADNDSMLKEKIAGHGLTYASALHTTVDEYADRVQELSAVRRVLASLEHFEDSCDRAFQAVADALIDESTADGCAIWLTTDTRLLTVRAARRFPVQSGTTGDLATAVVPPFASMLSVAMAAFQQGTPVVSTDVSRDPEIALSSLTPPVGSLIAWPLRSKRAVVGVIVLTHPHPDALTEDLQRLLGLIEAQLGIVLGHLLSAESAQLSSSHLAWEAARTDAVLARLRHQIQGGGPDPNLLPELVESIPIALALVDLGDSRLRSWNNAFAQLVDQSSEALEDLRFSSLLNASSDWEQLVAEVDRMGGFLNREQRLRCPFGRSVWVSVSAHTVAAGKERLVLLTVLDIAHHKQTETRLERTEQKLLRKVKEQESLIRLGRAVHGMAKLSDVGPLMSVFLRELKGLGIAVDAVAIHRLVSERNRMLETVRLVDGKVENARYGGRDRLFDCWRSGETVYLPNLTDDQADHLSKKFRGRDIRSTMDIPLAHGVASIHSCRPKAFDTVHEGLLREMSETLSLALARVRDLEALQVSEGRLRQIVDNVSVGVCLLDASRQILRANSAATDLLDLLKEQDAANPFADDLWDKMASVPDGTPVEMTTDDGHILEIAQYAAAGEVGEDIVLLLRDITVQRNEAHRQQQQDRLAVVGELAAGIAHDFNNTLTATIGASDLVKRLGGVPDKVRQHLDLISREGERAAGLVRQILDFSRKTEVERVPLSVGRSVDACCHLLDHVMPPGIELRVEADCKRHCVRANETQVQQVITNLVLNARDAITDDGTITVSTSLIDLESPLPLEQAGEPDVPPGSWVVLCVSDTGSGIPREVRDRIFEPFFTTKPQGEGTGLGLSQVYGIIKQHEGYVDVVDGEGGGTSFVVYLPVWAKDEPGGDDVEIGGHGRTVLVVEDKHETLEITVSMLSELGYQVITATDGQRALETFRARADEIDLVLTDLNMPGATGRELASAIQQQMSDMPVVIASGVGVTQSVPGPDNVTWIQKPFRLKDLDRALAERLSSRT